MRFGVFAAAAVCAAAYDETELSQVAAEEVDWTQMFNDGADLFAQLSDEEKNAAGTAFVQTHALVSDAIDNMAQADKEQYYNFYAQVRDQTFNILSQLSEDDRATVGEMLSQTAYGQYGLQNVDGYLADDLNNYFSQISWSFDDEEADGETLAQIGIGAVGDDELDDMAEFMAQLNDEQMEKLNQLVETKKEELGEFEEDEI